jgi:cobyrinic acid a,c-diamide synthase
MGALVNRGHAVQPFKVGPDFIDPSHHTRICGRVSRNLDPFMMGEDGCLDTFARASAGAGIAVIEGVMGLYDGVDGGDLASTAHVARTLSAPVILVVDVKGMSRSVHALIRGFRDYDPSIHIAGVIVNRCGSPRHRQMMEEELALPSFGWIPRTDAIATKSRHLGLVMAHESDTMAGVVPVIEEHCNLDAIVAAAVRAPALPARESDTAMIPARARIGIARDSAFCFYYQDNFDLLARSGAELVFFSPLADRLPAVDALYIGGGYPELFLPGLEAASCTAEIRQAADDGMPILGECGGLMYLTREVTGEARHRMTGILPADTEMTKRIQALGYVKGTVSGAGSFLPAGLGITGHEFHYSRIDPDRDARFMIRLSRGKGIDGGSDALYAANALGMYTHGYFSPAFARDFTEAAHAYSRT